MKTHIINAQTGQSEIRDLTVDETTKYNADIIKARELKEQEAQAKTAKENNKASGKQKLKDLGLDDEEIKALVG